ncbi:MAG: hypothetical protein GQ535_06265 [Rhodobacteraceae bacterium]|nr:hypothetical protein [Paracoccaceae bacterium]
MVDFTSDCQNCAALCCVALAFDKGDMFAFDKPAGVPCQHLNGPLCNIHTKLEAESLKGCVQYQCDGAGQRVVQEVFAGQSWQDTSALLPPMLEAFAQMRQVHALLLLLNSAKALPLPEAQLAELKNLTLQLSPEAWTPESLASFERSNLPQTVRAFFQSLKNFLPQR